MNHVYRVVWNACTATFQVVSEIAKGDGRSQGGKTSQGGARYAAEPRLGAAALAVALVLLGLSQPTLAGPEGGSVARGDASISQSGTATTINQGSDRAVINWSRFSV
ncbi:MAG: ESPR domain-containing protein, partial [Hydrogenophaga sp.]|nr:ESPR domain-containing protein [Hydrogenophaga sp.]